MLLPSPATAQTMGLERGAAWFTDYGFNERPFAVGPAWQVYMDYESVIFAPASRIGVNPANVRGGGVAHEWWDGFDGSVEVLWAARLQRFVAVAPLAPAVDGGCRQSRLKIAVSKSGDPRAPWIFSEVDVPYDSRDFGLGASDDKLLISSRDFCGPEPKGSFIRVIDLADLIDGGRVTIQDVTPTETDTYRWIVAQSVPVAGSNRVGNALHLVAVHEVNGAWTSFSYAKLDGTARDGTAHLSAPLDLTAAGIVAPYANPAALNAADQQEPDPDPVVQAALMNAGRGPTSAAARDGRLWAAFNRVCRPDGDTRTAGAPSSSSSIPPPRSRRWSRTRRSASSEPMSDSQRWASPAMAPSTSPSTRRRHAASIRPCWSEPGAIRPSPSQAAGRTWSSITPKGRTRRVEEASCRTWHRSGS
ncbi:MAG: hypothetical protein H0V73_02640 [Chloroflexi bacterium]|nr:hypothetical protein [Chloroflexota bacterium]